MSLDEATLADWRRRLDEGRALWWGPGGGTLHAWRVGRWYWVAGPSPEERWLVERDDLEALREPLEARAVATLPMKEGHHEPARARDPFVDASVVLEVVVEGFWTETLTFALEADGRVRRSGEAVCNDGSGAGSAGEPAQTFDTADAAIAAVCATLAARGSPDVYRRR